MVNTSRVIANGLRSPGTNEHTPGIHDKVDHLLGILDLEDQVFRSVLVAELHGLLDRLDLHGDGVGDRATDNLDARKLHGLTVELVLDSLKVLLVEVDGDQDDLAVNTVLGLGQEIRGNESGVGILVGDDENFGGAGGHVDADGGVGVVADEHLGGGDELVTGAENLVDLGDALGAVGHSSHGLSTAGKHDGLGANLVSDVYNLGSDGAVSAGRRGEHNLLAAGYHGGNTEHEGGAREDGGTTGDVAANSLNGARETAADNTRHGLDLKRLLLLLGSVELADVLEGHVNSRDGFLRELHELLGEGRLQDGASKRSGLLELVSVGQNSLVTVLADVLDDGDNDLVDGIGRLLRGALEGSIEVLDRNSGGVETSHGDLLGGGLLSGLLGDGGRSSSRNGRVRLDTLLLGPLALSITSPALDLPTLGIKALLDVSKSNASGDSPGKSKVEEIGSLEGNLLGSLSGAELLGLFHDLGPDKLLIGEETGSVGALRGGLFPRNQSLLELGETLELAKAAGLVKVAETALLLHDKLERIVIAVKRDTDELLSVSGSSTLVPETALPALIDTSLCPEGLVHTLGTAVDQAQGSVVLINDNGGEETIGTVRLPDT